LLADRRDATGNQILDVGGIERVALCQCLQAGSEQLVWMQRGQRAGLFAFASRGTDRVDDVCICHNLLPGFR